MASWSSVTGTVIFQDDIEWIAWYGDWNLAGCLQNSDFPTKIIWDNEVATNCPAANLKISILQTTVSYSLVPIFKNIYIYLDHVVYGVTI